MADRFSGFVRRGPRVAAIEARGFEDRASVIVAMTACGLLVAAEAALLLGGLLAGAVASGLALVGLIALALARGDRPEGRLCVALAVVPVLRLAGIALPAVILPQHTWYVIVGVPVLVAIALAARALALRPRDLGLRRSSPREVALLAAAGAPLGLAAFVIAGPDPVPPGLSMSEMVITSLALVVFGAFLEELLLRGLVQRVATELVGDWAVIASAALTGLLYATSLNARYVVFMVAVALLLGVVARRTGSIAAPTAGHAVLLWTQAVLWPLVLR